MVLLWPNKVHVFSHHTLSYVSKIFITLFLLIHSTGVKAESELELNVVTRSASYAESAVESRKLKVESPTDSEVFDFPVPVSYWKEPPKTMHVEVEITDQRKAEKPRDYKRTNSSISNKSTVSEISRMMWNLSNLPENADPKMVAWGLVDHNGGKFTIGNTGVSLTVPPLAIPEGHTEGIYIAIVDQEKEHPQITSKESLLSPVVKCGPTGLKFQRPVILSMPHCALNEEGTWNLKGEENGQTSLISVARRSRQCKIEWLHYFSLIVAC